MKRSGSDETLRCSFCHKSQDAVGKLISSPSDYPRAYICDECIAVCNSILEDDRNEPAAGLPNKLPKPLEIKEYLDQYETLTNEQATIIANKVFAWEGKRLELKRSWFKKFAEVIPATKAAKFYQVENQINAALDLKLMDSMPLIK